MSVDKRLDEIVNILKNAEGPVSGSFLSKQLGVSRQIIVGDITRLKEKEIDIIATSKGYVLSRAGEVSKVFKVHHNAQDTEKELNLIVDLGAEVRDVFIFHRVYGQITAKLNIRSRKDVRQFMENIENGSSNLLTTATDGYHYHTIIADDEKTMLMVAKELKENGFLARLTDYEPECVTKD